MSAAIEQCTLEQSRCPIILLAAFPLRCAGQYDNNTGIISTHMCSVVTQMPSPACLCQLPGVQPRQLYELMSLTTLQAQGAMAVHASIMSS